MMKFKVCFHDVTYGPDNIPPMESQYYVNCIPVPNVGDFVVDVKNRRRQVKSITYDYQINNNKTIISILMGDKE